MLQYNPSITGSLQVTGSLLVTGNEAVSGSLTVLGGIIGAITGSATSASYAVSASEASTLQGLGSASFAPAATFNTVSQSYASASGSLSTRVTTNETNIATLTSASASFATMSGSLSTRVTNLEATSSTVSQSFASTSGSISSRVTLIEGQYATTGSNNFTAPQQISDVSNAISFTSTASLYTEGGLRVKGSSFISGTAYFNDVVVYGTSSIEYITSSQIAIGTNLITLNTDTPSVRYGGISVFDSGSNNLSTGSLFWDSEKDKWIYSNPSGSTYDGGMLISGPRNTSGLGNEKGTTACYLMAGQGGDHITSSVIYTDSTVTCIPTPIIGVSNACFASTVCVGTNLVVRSAATFCDTVGLFGGSSQLYIGATSNASDFAIMSWCATNKSLNIQNQSVGSGPQLIIACNGKVGVAVSDPIVQFHVRTNVASENRPTNLATSATNSAVYFTTIGGSSAGIAFGQLGANTNYIQATYENGSVSTPLSLNPYDGNTGVGITSPQAKLDILSTLNIQASNNSDVPYINFSNNGRSFNWGRIGGLLQGDGDGALYFSTKLGGDVTEKLRITSVGIACFACTVCAPLLRLSGSTNIILQPSFIGGSNLRNGGAIQYSKNFTIFTDDGATGCGFDLQYWNGSSYYPGLRLNNVSSGFANLLLIQDGGNVGIGTTSPTGPLEVYRSCSGGLGGHIILNNNGTANFNETGIIFNDSGIGSAVVTRAAITSMVCGEPYNGDIRFKTGLGVYSCLSTRMIITGLGSIGISNTVPLHNLDIGSVRTNIGGFAFCNMVTAQGTWSTFACVGSDANVVTTITYTNTNDHNRSGVFIARWSYNDGCASLFIRSCLWNDSQNIVTLAFRNFQSGALQICVSGGGGDYRVQAFTQGTKAT